MELLNLTHGSGDGVHTACAVTAAGMLVGQVSEAEYPECVCSTLTEIVPALNDNIPEHLLRKVFAGIPEVLVGTATSDEAVMWQRVYIAADTLLRKIVPRFRPVLCDKATRNLLPIKSASTASEAVAAYTRGLAEERAPYFARMLEEFAKNRGVAWAASDIAEAASDVLESVFAGDGENHRLCAEMCRDMVLEMCEIGEKQEIPHVMTYEDLCNALQETK